MRDTAVRVLDRCFHSGGILSYHAIVDSNDVPSPEMHVSALTLRRHLTYVRDRYDVLPLHELIARRECRRSTDGCVAITFDDAYAGVEHLAAPILRDLDLPATIFVTARVAEHGGSFWWDELELARRAARPNAWFEMFNALGLPAPERSRTSIAIARDRIIARHAGRFELPRPQPESGAPQTSLPDLLRAMDVAGLRRLGSDTRFDFGCHTLTHPALPFLPATEQEREMRAAQRWLQDRLPHVVPIVAYPFGLYDADTIGAAQRAGLNAGVTMQPRALDTRDTAYALPRVGVSEDWTPSSIGLRMNTGLSSLFIARMGGRHPRLPADPRRVMA
jgi:peptidoglycan/xylan/chitin deacetylase (PgdA/CDA1 family)